MVSKDAQDGLAFAAAENNVSVEDYSDRVLEIDGLNHFTRLKAERDIARLAAIEADPTLVKAVDEKVTAMKQATIDAVKIAEPPIAEPPVMMRG